MSESKEVAKKEKNEVGMPQGAWGAAENIGVDEVSLSKILLMQPLSDLVDAGKAKAGEFRDNVSGELVGGEDKPFEVMIIHRYLTWTIFDGPKYDKTVPVTDENRDWGYYAEGDVTRSKTFNFYCVFPDNLERLPAVMSLKNMAANTARAMQTYFMELRTKDKSSAASVLSFVSEKQENDKGKFYVPKFTVARDATPEELAKAYEWYQFVRQLEDANKLRVSDDNESVDKKPALKEDEGVPF